MKYFNFAPRILNPYEYPMVENKELFELLAGYGHEQVVICNDPHTGLKAIIAIHNTVLGPALGGTRFWQYATDYEALVDALRLSEGMTYKAAITGLNLGGGKAVIIGNSRTDKSEALFRRYGKFVQSLSGKYITAEDVGTTKQDMLYINMETKHVSGLPEYMGGSGDPSPVTAFGVYMGMKASASKTYGNDSLNGKKILIQGIGNVGINLAGYCLKEGAEVFISDIFEDQIKKALATYPSLKVIAATDDIYKLDIDIYAPCALGATLNDVTIPQLKCRIVAGAANNQLKDSHKHGQMLTERGILYAPDFLINAGGLINVYSELHGYNREQAMGQAENIYNTTLSIFEKAEHDKITTHEAALALALQRIDQIKNIKAVL